MINLLNSYLEIVKVGEIIIRTDLAISSLISDSPTSLQIAACRSVWNRGGIQFVGFCSARKDFRVSVVMAHRGYD